jgi:hypothetical protein
VQRLAIEQLVHPITEALKAHFWPKMKTWMSLSPLFANVVGYKRTAFFDFLIS